MTSPPRHSIRRLVLTILFAIAATSIPWLEPVSDVPLGPTVVWAGGSPDETLSPPPGPPKRTRNSGLEHRPPWTEERSAPPMVADDARAVKLEPGSWLAIWKAYVASVLMRF